MKPMQNYLKLQYHSQPLGDATKKSIQSIHKVWSSFPECKNTNVEAVVSVGNLIKTAHVP